MLQTWIRPQDLQSSIVNPVAPDIGHNVEAFVCNFFVIFFDIQYRKSSYSAQPLKVSFMFP